MKKIFLTLFLIFSANIQLNALNINTRLGLIFEWITQNQSTPIKKILSTKLYADLDSKKKDEVLLKEIIDIKKTIHNIDFILNNNESIIKPILDKHIKTIDDKINSLATQTCIETMLSEETLSFNEFTSAAHEILDICAEAEETRRRL